MAAFLFLFINASWAASSGKRDFYGTKAEGWFWYNDPVIEEVIEEKPPSPPPAPSVPTIPPLSTEWLKNNLPIYMNTAIDNPTKENISTYLYLQKISLDKATEFSTQVAFVTQGNPDLDENTRNPVSSYAKKAVKHDALKTENELIKQISTKGGLWFFYKSDCPYCVKMAPNISALQDRFGLTVSPISLDGRPLPGGYFDTFSVNNGQAEDLGVEVTPSIYLVYPPESITPVTFGIVSMKELKKRIINAASQIGIIDKKQFNKANSVLTVSPASSQNKMTSLKQSDTTNKQKFLDSLENLYRQN